MNLVKIPKLSDIYFFCSQLINKGEPSEQDLQLVQANILDVRRLGAFLEHSWPIDKRTCELEILPSKAAYLTYHLFEGNFFFFHHRFIKIETATADWNHFIESFHGHTQAPHISKWAIIF